MKKLLVLVVAIVALYIFKPGLFPSFAGKNGAFDAKGNPQVLVFTAKECSGLCEKAMQELRARSVVFQELQLDGNDDNLKRYEKLGGNGPIPYIVTGKLVVSGYDKGKTASALGQTYGDKYLTRMEQIYYGKHFKADGTPIVYMYGASWCVFCKSMRDEMDKRKIEYAEVDVEAVADRTVMEDTMQISGFPLIYVGYERIVGGESVEPVVAALKKAKKRQI